MSEPQPPRWWSPLAVRGGGSPRQLRQQGGSRLPSFADSSLRLLPSPSLLPSALLRGRYQPSLGKRKARTKVLGVLSPLPSSPVRFSALYTVAAAAGRPVLGCPLLQLLDSSIGTTATSWTEGGFGTTSPKRGVGCQARPSRPQLTLFFDSPLQLRRVFLPLPLVCTSSSPFNLPVCYLFDHPWGSTTSLPSRRERDQANFLGSPSTPPSSSSKRPRHLRLPRVQTPPTPSRPPAFAWGRSHVLLRLPGPRLVSGGPWPRSAIGGGSQAAILAPSPLHLPLAMSLSLGIISHQRPLWHPASSFVHAFLIIPYLGQPPLLRPLPNSCMA